MTVFGSDRPVLLLVEDDATLLSFLADQLCADGFDVDTTSSAEIALTVAASRAPDIAVVAVNGGSGREFARTVRAGGSGVDQRLPMILLGGAAVEADTLRALDAGADDYLAKPFAYPVLHARCRALLRRVELDTSRAARRVRFAGPLMIDQASRSVTVDDRPVEQLSAKEFEVLWILAGEPTRVFTRPELLRATGIRTEKTLRDYVGQVRRKLADAGRPGWIVARWGLGYALRADDRVGAAA